MNPRVLATILAALRYWQREGLISSGHEHDIASNNETLEPLTSGEIDTLCEALSFDEHPQPPMNTPTLLGLLSNREKETLLLNLLENFETAGSLNPRWLRFRLSKPQNTVAEQLEQLLAIAGTRQETLAALNLDTDEKPADDQLDDVIHDSFSEAASDINNGGTHAQASYLLIEAGWSAEQIHNAVGGAPA